MFVRHADAIREAAKRLSSRPDKYRGYNIERCTETVGGRVLAVGYRVTMILRRA